MVVAFGTSADFGLEIGLAGGWIEEIIGGTCAVDGFVYILVCFVELGVLRRNCTVVIEVIIKSLFLIRLLRIPSLIIIRTQPFKYLIRISILFPAHSRLIIKLRLLRIRLKRTLRLHTRTINLFLPLLSPLRIRIQITKLIRIRLKVPIIPLTQYFLRFLSNSWMKFTFTLLLIHLFRPFLFNFIFNQLAIIYQ